MGSDGRPVERCRLHGGDDIIAASLEEAYSMMNADTGDTGLSSSSYFMIRDSMPTDGIEPVMGIPGSGSALSRIL